MKHFPGGPGKAFSVCVLALAALVPAMHASEIFTFTEDGCSGSCGPQSGGFGSVTLDQVDADDVLVTVDLFNGNEFVTNGTAHDAFAFNIGGAAVTLTGFGSFSIDSSPRDSPYGPFDYALSCKPGCGPGGSSPVPGPLVFTASRSTGLSITDFVADGPDGIFFAADIISGTNTNTGAVGALAGVAVSPRSTAPEPATFGLMGFALLAVGIIGKRIRQSN